MVLVGLIGGAAQLNPTKDKLKDMTTERDEALVRLNEADAQTNGLNSEINSLTLERDLLREDMISAEAAAAEAIAQAEGERDEALKERGAAMDERDTALSDAVKVQTDLEAVLTRFDPQIQAAIAQLVGNADSTVCFVGDAAGYSNQPMPNLDAALDPVVSAIPDAALPGGPSEYLSMPALEQRLQACYDSGKQRGTLQGPHGDGFFTIGVEMAAGRWRSDGTGSSCYWQISPDGNPDDIIDNHFGNAGGTVTLRDGQEFESDGCGTWTLV